MEIQIVDNDVGSECQVEIWLGYNELGQPTLGWSVPSIIKLPVPHSTSHSAFSPNVIVSNLVFHVTFSLFVWTCPFAHALSFWDKTFLALWDAVPTLVYWLVSMAQSSVCACGCSFSSPLHDGLLFSTPCGPFIGSYSSVLLLIDLLLDQLWEGIFKWIEEF